MNWIEVNLIFQAWWIKVDRRYKTALAIAFPITLMAFSIFTFHYLLIDHDAMLPDISPTDQFFAGRWFARFCFWLTAYSNIPVFQQVLSMFFQLGAGAVALRLWGLRSLTSFGTTVVLVIIAVHPNNLTTYFYTHWSLMYTFSALLAAIGMLIASKAIDNSGLPCKLIGIVAGGVLVCLAIATYQASMGVAATLAAGYAIMRLVEHRGDVRNLLWKHLMPVWSMAASSILGGVFYMPSLRMAGIIREHAGGVVLSTDLPRKFVEVTLKSFYGLWVTQPEFSRPLKIVLLTALILAAGSLAAAVVRCHPYAKTRIIAKWVLLSLLLVGLVMTTKTLFYTVNIRSFFIYRYNLSMPFFSAFCFYAIFATSTAKRFGLWRSVVAIAACCIIFTFVRSNLLRQGILLAGHRHDMAMANRILERVESIPGLDFTKRYYYVRLGPYSQERTRMLNTLRPYDTPGGGHMDFAEIGSSGWTAEVPLKALGSRIIFKSILDNLPAHFERAKSLVEKHNAKRWPDRSSVIVDGDMIVANM